MRKNRNDVRDLKFHLINLNLIWMIEYSCKINFIPTEICMLHDRTAIKNLH